MDTVRSVGNCFPAADPIDSNRTPKLIAWLEHLMEISDTGLEEMRDPLARQNAVLKTATADWEWDPQQDYLKRSSESHIDGIYKILTGEIEPVGETHEDQVHWYDERLESYRQAMEWSGTRRRSFVSLNGRIGLGPQSLQPGDSVAEIAGTDVPFALRRREDGGYQLVGEVYMHGVMDGEHRHQYFEKLSWPERQIFEVY